MRADEFGEIDEGGESFPVMASALIDEEREQIFAGDGAHGGGGEVGPRGAFPDRLGRVVEEMGVEVDLDVAGGVGKLRAELRVEVFGRGVFIGDETVVNEEEFGAEEIVFADEDVEVGAFAEGEVAVELSGEDRTFERERGNIFVAEKFDDADEFGGLCGVFGGDGEGVGLDGAPDGDRDRGAKLIVLEVTAEERAESMGSGEFVDAAPFDGGGGEAVDAGAGGAAHGAAGLAKNEFFLASHRWDDFVEKIHNTFSATLL